MLALPREICKRNMLPGEPKRTSAIDEERERQHNGGNNGASEASSQEDSEGQEEEKNPSIVNPQWKNADGQPITKALVGDEVLLCAEVQDIADGTSAKIKIVEKDADGNDDDVATLTATVSGGKIECKWKVIYTEDDDDANSELEKSEKGYTLPEYAFTVECGGATSEESPQLDVKGFMKIRLIDKDTLAPLKNRNYVLYHRTFTSDKMIQKGKSDENGYIEINDLNYIFFNIDIEEEL